MARTTGRENGVAHKVLYTEVQEPCELPGPSSPQASEDLLHLTVPVYRIVFITNDRGNCSHIALRHPILASIEVLLSFIIVSVISTPLYPVHS
jgi:hypothetical protein